MTDEQLKKTAEQDFARMSKINNVIKKGSIATAGSFFLMSCGLYAINNVNDALLGFAVSAACAALALIANESEKDSQQFKNLYIAGRIIDLKQNMDR